jgi:tRNA uracil 4-sulfurtransferase
MAVEQDHIILIRLGGELTIKSKRTRAQFIARLERNLGDALRAADISHRIERSWARFFVHAESPAALSVVTRVFGISSVSPIDRVVPADLDSIAEAGLEVFGGKVRGKRFAVRARRSGAHEFASRDVEIRLGAVLGPLSAGVDLGNPEFTASVEVRGEQAYLFSERVPAVGGLPLGVEGRAIALLSGGYDSAVSAWLLLKRGVELDYVFCNLGGEAYERAVVQVGKVIADSWSYGTSPRLHVVDFGPALKMIRGRVKSSYWQLILKRLMYRAACAVGVEREADAIVTGEAIGQVSSQTLSNLRTLEPAASLPVFRPLIGSDKEEIIAQARQIGTAALSEQVREYCAITPGRPVTAATMEAVNREEARLDLRVVTDAVANRRILDLRGLRPSDLVAPYLFTEEIGSDTVVFDCRPAAQFRAWHLPGASHRDDVELLRDFAKLPKEKTYVLYCAHGIQTAYIAERMQRAGYEAYSFRGGLRGIMALARERGMNLDALR